MSDKEKEKDEYEWLLHPRPPIILTEEGWDEIEKAPRSPIMDVIDAMNEGNKEKAMEIYKELRRQYEAKEDKELAEEIDGLIDSIDKE